MIDAGGGQLDLRALTDIVADADGRLVVDSADNGVRRVHVEVQLKYGGQATGALAGSGSGAGSRARPRARRSE